MFVRRYDAECRFLEVEVKLISGRKVVIAVMSSCSNSRNVVPHTEEDDSDRRFKKYSVVELIRE